LEKIRFGWETFVLYLTYIRGCGYRVLVIAVEDGPGLLEPGIKKYTNKIEMYNTKGIAIKQAPDFLQKFRRHLMANGHMHSSCFH